MIPSWEDILKRLGECGKKVIDEKEIRPIGRNQKMDDMTMKKDMEILYTTLVSYIKGDARAKVTTRGIISALGSYRHLN